MVSLRLYKFRTLRSHSACLLIYCRRSAFIKTLWTANKARPFAFGKLEDQCRDAIADDPDNEELKRALQMAVDERERAQNLQEEVEQAHEALSEALRKAEEADSARDDQTDDEKLAWFQREVDRLKSKLTAVQQDSHRVSSSLEQLKRLAETERNKLTEQNMQYEANAVEFKLSMSYASKKTSALNEALLKAKERQQEMREDCAAKLGELEMANQLARKEMADRFVKATSALSQMVLLPKDTVIGRPLEPGELEQLLLMLAEGGEPLEKARALGTHIRAATVGAAIPPCCSDIATQCDLGPMSPHNPVPEIEPEEKQAETKPEPVQPRRSKRTVRLLERKLPNPVPLLASPVRTVSGRARSILLLSRALVPLVALQ